MVQRSLQMSCVWDPVLQKGTKQIINVLISNVPVYCVYFVIIYLTSDKIFLTMYADFPRSERNHSDLKPNLKDPETWYKEIN